MRVRGLVCGLGLQPAGPEHRSRLIAIRPRLGRPAALLSRWALAAWYALGLAAQAAGLLPVRGWPLRPRPWPPWAAYGQALAVALSIEMPMLYYAERMPIVIAIISSFFSFLQIMAIFRSAGRRRLLCDIAVCLRFYCQRHALPGVGWCPAAAIAVFFLIKMTMLLFNSLLRGLLEDSFEIHVVLTMWRQFAQVVQVVQLNLSSCLILVHLTVVGALTTGLRRDCVQAFEGTCPDACLWRSLRLRQQILFDVFLAVHATAPERLLVLVMFTLVFPGASFAVMLSKGVPRLTHEVVINISIAVSIVLLFVSNGLASQWFSVESIHIRQVIHRYLARKRLKNDVEAEELKAFAQQIDRQSKKGSVMGLFELDSATVTGVIFTISTYCAFAIQNKNDLI